MEGNTFHAECASLTSAPIANSKVIATCYLIIPGFEIEQTYQKIITVQQIADGYSVSSEHRFEHQ